MSFIFIPNTRVPSHSTSPFFLPAFRHDPAASSSSRPNNAAWPYTTYITTTKPSRYSLLNTTHYLFRGTYIIHNLISSSSTLLSLTSSLPHAARGLTGGLDRCVRVCFLRPRDSGLPMTHLHLCPPKLPPGVSLPCSRDKYKCHGSEDLQPCRTRCLCLFKMAKWMVTEEEQHF